MTAPAIDFPIVWDDPADALQEWERDDMHMPFAVTPLSADYVRILVEGMAYGRDKLDTPYTILLRFWNGYVYLAARDHVGEADIDAAIDALIERKRALIPTTAAYWRDEALPELRAVRDWFRSFPIETASFEELADGWVEAWRRATRAWCIHFYAIRGPYQITDDLSDFYELVVADAPPGEALRLILGRADELHDVGRDLDSLTAIVNDTPELRAMVVGMLTPTVAVLRGMPAAAVFLDELDAFLDAHGHLGGSFDDLAFPSWAEAPDMVLADVARRIAAGGPSADERRDTLLAEADELANRVRTLLAGRDDELAQFERLLADARSIGPLTEIHNYWIDRLVHACLRGFSVRVGKRLTQAGVIDAAMDVMFLGRAEVEALLRAPEDQRAVVAERQVEHARLAAVVPPRHVGAPSASTAQADRFDGARFEAADDGSLRGTGASAGVVRGPARIVLGPQDFGKVQPGDVIVAPSSNPSWVPLFTVAGGLLTNTGGVVCHAAVVAREVGLPAVVGLGDATTRIPDGSIVELDGTTGIVRLL